MEEPDPHNISQSDSVQERVDERIEDNYDLLNPPIGEGSLGEVRKAKHKASGNIFAVRVINKATEKEKEKLLLEIDLVKELDHPNICKVIEYYN